MDKGTRIKVVKGRKHKGKTGTVFWSGPDKFNPGETRLGVNDDHGNTLWVSASYCEELTPSDDGFEPPSAEEAPTYAKGDRVQWIHGDAKMTGTVFWTGDSRAGGQRLGIRMDDPADPEDDAAWRDAKYVEPLEGEPAPKPGGGGVPSAMPGGQPGGDWAGGGGGDWADGGGWAGDDEVAPPTPGDSAFAADDSGAPPMAPPPDDTAGWGGEEGEDPWDDDEIPF